MESQFLVLKDVQKAYLYVTERISVELEYVTDVQADFVANRLEQLA